MRFLRLPTAGGEVFAEISIQDDGVYLGVGHQSSSAVFRVAR